MMIDTFLENLQTYDINVKIEQLQQVRDDIFSLVLPDCNTILILSCNLKKVIREIDYYHLNVYQVYRYFISDDLTYLVIVEQKKKKHISKILNLTDNKHYSIKSYQIFGVKKGLMLGSFQYSDGSKTHKKVIVLKQYELKNGNSLNCIYFDNIGNSYCQSFECSFLFVQTFIQRYQLFLKNYKRSQYYENQESSGPLSNFAHNKNYYIFGQNNRTQVKYMVRLNQRMKKIRQLSFNTYDQTIQLYGQWIYVRGANTQTKQFTFFRVNVCNAINQIINDNILIQQMIGTKDGRYLVLFDGKTLSINQIINPQ